jgi:hypothetical protein
LRHSLRPNKRFQPTPLRVDKILAILARGFCSTAFPVYWCGAAEAQGVSRLINVSLSISFS